MERSTDAVNKDGYNDSRKSGVGDGGGADTYMGEEHRDMRRIMNRE